MDIDVCIPVHDPLAQQEEYLDFLLLSISKQTQPPVNVYLTANHEIERLQSLQNKYGSFFNVVFKVNSSRGISENLNHVTTLPQSEIVKVMFQDDFLLDSHLFKEISDAFLNPGVIWSCAPSKNYSQSEMRFTSAIIPEIKKTLVEGVNSIGSPSVLSFRNGNWLSADESLKWMLDCDLYLRFGVRFGMPHVTSQFSVASRIHVWQATNWAESFQQVELDYLRKKHASINSYNFPK